MSSLYKLLLSGVRSFSPKDHETIQFGSPLTLICGQNGCGKTTIIESLKYATTGDLPPNSKGGAFVNDPTIADRLVVNAEIKLGFISVDGKLMTVTRNMQLNRKRAVRGAAGAAGAANTFKTLEGQLAVISHGRKTSISTKNLELDTRVPLYLGALKAILEYVIFCHQDDSLWPLSEAGVLKKRFDEIFEASKFTKVLDNLKAIRKDMAADIRLIQQSVQHAGVDKGRARRVREKVADGLAKVDQYSLEIAALTVQIEALERQAEALFNSNQEFHRTLSEHERLRLLLELLRTALRRLEASIAFLPELDSELAQIALNFSHVLAERTLELQQIASQQQSLEAEAAALQKDYHVLVRQEGSLAAKKQAHQERVERVADLKREQGFSGSNAELLGLSARNLKETTTESARVSAANGAQLGLAKDRVQAALDALLRERQTLSFTESEIAAAAEKHRALKEEVGAMAHGESSLEVEKSQLTAVQAKLEKRRAAFSAFTTTSLDADKARVALLESELEELMRRIASANKLADLHSKIELLRENELVKADVLRKMVAEHEPQFSSICGVSLDPVSAEAVLEEERRKLAQTQGQAKADHELQLHEKRQAEAALAAKEKSSIETRQKLQQHTQNILAVVTQEEIPQYEALVTECEEDYKTAVYNLNTFEVTKSFKIKAVEVAKQSNCCVLCNRGMDEKELQRFVDEIQANVAALTAEKLAADVEATQRDLQEMKSIQFDVLEYRRLSGEASTSTQELENARSKVVTATEKTSVKDRELSDVNGRFERVAELSRPILNIAGLHEEISGLQRQIAQLEEDILDYGASSESMAELQKLQQQKSFEVKVLRQTVSDATEEQNAQQKELSRLEAQAKDKELLISKLELSLNVMLGKKKEIVLLEERLLLLRQRKSSLESEVSLLSERHLAEAVLLESVQASCLEQECKVKEAEESARAEYNALKATLEEIEHFEETESVLVAENETSLARAKAAIEDVKAKQAVAEENAKKTQGFIADAEKTERNIRDNLEYRQTEKELQQQLDIMAEIDVKNAELEKSKYQDESRKLREQITELNLQHYGKVGEVKQIKDQIKSLQHELDTEFKDIDKQYHHEWIKLQTNSLVSNDLQTYSQALDNAIMKYHGMKMDEINRILRELWNQTYKGTDIDGIEIKCDVTNQTRGRSYNYRVVMFKKNTELDMRGRCSAGQKVLTSILIRLALAECFGTNCGMIALDEPTTNLDTENAESLANALNNIIDFRKSQKNFQLIVITHDEKFLSHINGDRYTDNFYRVERDENQHSVIKSLPIHLMQDE